MPLSVRPALLERHCRPIVSMNSNSSCGTLRSGADASIETSKIQKPRMHNNSSQAISRLCKHNQYFVYLRYH